MSTSELANMPAASPPTTASPPATSTLSATTPTNTSISSKPNSRSSSRHRKAAGEADTHNARSFSRLEPSPSRSLKTHSKTVPDLILVSTTAGGNVGNENGDETVESPGEFGGAGGNMFEEGEKTPMSAVLPERFEELPAEIIALTDRFLESLSAKIHPTPLTIYQLSGLFQDFYAVASTQISNHVSSLYLALKSKSRSQQLLSIEEIAQKRRDRRALEVKRLAMEEAVEKRVCEAVYERIWRHRSSDDEARDDMLRSKIQALNVVGVKLAHLGLGEGEDDVEMMNALKDAREALAGMSLEKSPLGKLNILRTIHKNIVDVLTTSASTSGQHSSADQILPTLIFTLLHSPPNISVLSDLFFIQRFRCRSRLDGEAAYCLTNLEAAISFLETVDLASLELLDSNQDVKERWPTLPPKEEPSSPTKVFSEPVQPSAAQVTTTNTTATTLVVPASPSKPQSAGGISLLTPVEFVGSAVVTTAGAGLGLGSAVVSTADHSLKTLGNTLESSYRFLVGKMNSHTDVSIPKTLEDARKLVDHPPEQSDPELNNLLAASTEPTTTTKLELTSTPLARSSSQASQSSVLSNTSTRKAAKSAASTTKPSAPTSSAPTRPTAHSVSSAPIAAFTTIGSSLGKFAGLGMRGFQRATSGSTPAVSTPTSNTAPAPPPINTTKSKEEPAGRSSVEQADLLTAFPDLAKEIPGLRRREKPEVVKRFLEVGDVGELKVGEVGKLLEEYKRLAEWVKDA